MTARPAPADRRLSWARAETWSLVLETKAIPHTIEKEGDGFRILVEPGFERAARRQIRLFRSEALADRKASRIPALAEHQPGLFPLLAGLAVALFFLFGQSGPPGRELLARGGGWAREILAGEWWRTVTALTLHADFGHLASNLLFGGVIIGALQRLVGSGPAWLASLAAGSCGNLVNALLQAGTHRSIGASTAVFGALGALAVLGIPTAARGARWLPLGAGLGLLVFLGFSPTTDVGAHLLGFCAGLPIGMLLRPLRRRNRRQRLWGLIGKTCAAAIPLLCWLQAFRHGG